MTPFGEKIRDLRRQKGTTQKEMAATLGVSAAYLSALEHGQRGIPTWLMLQQIIGYFGVIWDEAEELQDLAYASHPNVTINTSNLSARATECANTLALSIDKLDDELLENISLQIKAHIAHKKPLK